MHQRHHLERRILLLGKVAGDGPPEDADVDVSLRDIIKHLLAGSIVSRVDDQRVRADVFEQSLVGNQRCRRRARNQADVHSPQRGIIQPIDVDVPIGARDDRISRR